MGSSQHWQLWYCDENGIVTTLESLLGYGGKAGESSSVNIFI